MNRLIGLFALLLVLSACTATRTSASAPPMTEEQMNQRMMEIGTPGEAHQKLNPMAGQFKADITMWMSADAPPQKSEGTMSAQWIYGGRYLRGEFKSSFMEQPFEGVSLVGYSVAAGCYEGSWIDSMSTMIYPVSQGTLKGSTFEFRREMLDPILNVPSYSREVLTIHNNDSHTLEGYSPGQDGKEFKMMEIRYTRVN